MFKDQRELDAHCGCFCVYSSNPVKECNMCLKSTGPMLQRGNVLCSDFQELIAVAAFILPPPIPIKFLHSTIMILNSPDVDLPETVEEVGFHLIQ